MMKMKRTLVLAVVVLAGLVAFYACQPYGRKTYYETSRPSPNAEEVWSYIKMKDPYTGWKFLPGYEGIYPGQSPHGAYLKLYVNDEAYEAVRNGMKMPNGAMLVKENYGKDKETLVAVTPMYKIEGYNPEAGDWFWAKYGLEGEVMAAGKV